MVTQTVVSLDIDEETFWVPGYISSTLCFVAMPFKFFDSNSKPALSCVHFDGGIRSGELTVTPNDVLQGSFSLEFVSDRRLERFTLWSLLGNSHIAVVETRTQNVR